MPGVLNILAGSIASAIKDGYFNLVTLLLPGNGTNGAQNNTFLDSSTNNFTITRNGNATQGTFSPFSQTGWSNAFNGSSDYLSITSTSALQLDNATAFTIEFWVYPNSIPASGSSAFVLRAYNLSSPFQGYGIAFGGNALNTNLQFWDGTAWADIGTVSANQWTHVAITYTGSGTTRRYFINGVQQGSAATVPSSINWTGTGFIVGARNADMYFNGYISNLRVLKGTAQYTAAFTPPTSALTAITNTSLLTCQDNRFRDASSNAFAITVNGNPSVQAFSPFAPTAAYDATTVGGSGYFDGTGDYLSVSQTAGNFGTSNWSIECYYCNSAAYAGTVYPRIVSKSVTAANTSGAWGLGTRNGTTDEVWFSYNNGVGFIGISTGINANDFAWHHLLTTYDGSRIRVFVDGILRANAVPTISSFGTATGDPVLIGYQSRDTNYINGYVSGLRIVNGGIPTSYQTSSTTNGTSIFTPPSAPVTTSSQGASGTSLLLNFTNAGIIDSTAKNVLETVGNAQISTTQSKFGGSSMYFDGTGDYLTFPSTQNLAMGSGDWTFEAWIYIANTTGLKTICDQNSGQRMLWYVDGTSLKYYTAAGVQITGGTLSATTWTHVALVRSSGSTKMYVNGTQVGSSYTDSQTYGTGLFVVGGNAVLLGNDPMNGYIDDLRITKGYARYTTTFTPPAAALPLQ